MKLRPEEHHVPKTDKKGKVTCARCKQAFPDLKTRCPKTKVGELAGA